VATVPIDDASFETAVLQADKPVLVEFFEDWCGPCKQMDRALEQISEELADDLIVAKLDTGESVASPTRYGVLGIPTLMLFRGGQMVSMKVGPMPKFKILEWLDGARAKG
jgi:thioredoxin 1